MAGDGGLGPVEQVWRATPLARKVIVVPAVGTVVQAVRMFVPGGGEQVSASSVGALILWMGFTLACGVLFLRPRTAAHPGGLSIRGRIGPVTTVPWSAVRSVRLTPTGAVLDTVDGPRRTAVPVLVKHPRLVEVTRGPEFLELVSARTPRAG